MWEKIKAWLWLAPVALGAFLISFFKPKWVKEKEKEVKQRDQDIAKAETDLEELKSEHERVRTEHDEAIKEAQQRDDKKESVPFDNPSDAAKYLDDLLSK